MEQLPKRTAVLDSVTALTLAGAGRRPGPAAGARIGEARSTWETGILAAVNQQGVGGTRAK